MPIIRLPDDMRDVITGALNHDLGQRIEKGRAVAVLTYQRTEDGDHKYIVEFKNPESPISLASYYGHSNRADGTEPVLLSPYLKDPAEALAHDVGSIDDGGFVMRHHTPPTDRGMHDFRVEFIPPGSSAVHLALEAKAWEGQIVPMQRADLYPVKG